MRVGQESGTPVRRLKAHEKVRARAVERKRTEHKRTFQRQDHQNLKVLGGGGVTEKNRSKMAIRFQLGQMEDKQCAGMEGHR